VPKLIVTETKPLHGKVRISGAKNSVLPIIAASILGDSESVIEEVPDLTDVKIMCELLESFGWMLIFYQINPSCLSIHGIF